MSKKPKTKSKSWEPKLGEYVVENLHGHIVQVIGIAHYTTMESQYQILFDKSDIPSEMFEKTEWVSILRLEKSDD